MTTLIWICLSIQILMGAIDTLYHHELTERLAWRTNQADELKLHAVRNLAYAITFIMLAFWQPMGLVAGGLLGLLLAEVVVTLRDFVEEDRTRKLPETERILHTLMTANYGVLLFLLIPVLWAWAQGPTGLDTVWYGLWSVLLILGAIAVTIFAIRDWHASIRTPNLYRRPAQAIALKGRKRRWLITGGTGFIGRRLIEVLQTQGHEIIVLTRNGESAALPPPISYVTHFDQIPTDTKIDVIVNFAGEPLAQGLWTQAKKVEFRRSRLHMTRNIGKLLNRLTHQPEVLINGSAIGIYGIIPTGPQDEYSPIEKDQSFSQKLCLDWEKEANSLGRDSLRIVCLRIGMVLDRDGAALAQLLVPTELGGGARFGDGKFMMSWITRDDLVRLIQFAANTPDIKGPLNGTAPEPVSNLRFTRALAKALYRPAFMVIPKAVIKCLGGLGREILLGDQTILPRKALEHGFEFLDPEIETALENHLRPQRQAKIAPAKIRRAT